MKIGEKATFSKTITESDISLFAGISGDCNPIHIDKIEAEKGIFGKPIAHGFLAGSLISAAIGMKLPGPGTLYLEQDLRFLKPVFIGDTLTSIVEINEILNPEKGIYRLDTKVVNQKNEMVIDGYAVVKKS